MNQQPHRTPSILGGALIIAGTVMGAGMFANPTATAGIWYSGSLWVLAYTWFCMLTSGLMLLEVHSHYAAGASFDTLVRDLLGPVYNIINGLAVAFVLYILTYAYIFVGGDLTTQSLNQWGFAVPLFMGQLLFFALLAACVVWSTGWVDRLSRILLGGMVLTFFLATGHLLGQVQLPLLLDSHAAEGTRYWPYVLTALPVCLASFGFHGNVASLYKYYHADSARVAKALWLGTLMALLIYVLWQTAIQGNLPRHAFAPVIAADGQVSVLINALAQFTHHAGRSMAMFLSLFAYMAIATSFLGVTLGLFDFLADVFGWGDDRLGRSKTAALTFLPPLTACLLYPTGFVTVIGYVGLAAAVWTALIPALLVYRSRQRLGLGRYRVYGGVGLMLFVFAFGIISMAAHILTRWGWVPVFSGS